MIVRPPNRAVMIRIFRCPRRKARANTSPGYGEIGGLLWKLVSNTPVDEDVEDAFARASLAYYRGQYDETLDELEALARFPQASFDLVVRADVTLARAEVLIVMGRASDAIRELEAFLTLPRSAGQLLRRSWLYAAKLESGDATGAAEELAFLESDEHMKSELGASGLLQLAWFMAFFGDFDRSEADFVRYIALPPVIARSDHETLSGYLKTAALLARAGAAGPVAEDWIRGLEGRLLNSAKPPS